MTKPHLSDLNPEQRRAVEYGGLVPAAGLPPLLIIAGAGSGKTNTLAHRVAHLIANGADPRRVMLLTFSRRAATEMTRRVEGIAGRIVGDAGHALSEALSWAGTFHAVGARLLREYVHDIGLDPAFTIHDREDSADLLNLVRHELGFSRTEKRFPAKGTCLAIYSRVVNSEDPLDKVLKETFPWCASWEAELKKLFAAYVESKQQECVLDYDDLLLYWAQMMGIPHISADISSRFDHIFVDEYQDTNRLQASILLAIKPDGKGLTVVGDDAQSIYSFRAATVRNILEFPKQFTPNAEITTLERNYRSTQPVLAAANAVISLANERYTKNLWSERASSERPQLVSLRDEADQAVYVADVVLENREAGIPLKSQAVLFRTSHHSAALEIELTRRNVPFVKFGGLKFLEAAHIKDVLAVLRWAQNPRARIAGYRVLQLLPGVGPKTAARLFDSIGERDALNAIRAFEPPQAAAVHWSEFGEIIRLLHGESVGWPEALELVCRWYGPHLERIYDDAMMRQADLVQLTQIALSYPNRERFLTELTLDPPDATSDKAGAPLLDDDYLILSTIHSAKGQEWKSVFILNCVDGCIPSDLATGTTEEIEEERRLLYVAMTRAKDHLHLIVPQRFYSHQQQRGGSHHMYAARTRFIEPSMLKLFANTAWPTVTASDENKSRLHKQRVDIGMRLRARWQ